MSNPFSICSSILAVLKVDSSVDCPVLSLWSVEICNQLRKTPLDGTGLVFVLFAPISGSVLIIERRRELMVEKKLSGNMRTNRIRTAGREMQMMQHASSIPDHIVTGTKSQVGSIDVLKVRKE